ncbi:uncharacterized protein LOC113231970 [Hyposmocoma kahamanoa]|uniref:uncharacterized protein LOC113231970 n=1 Tax=Hyposmocoma kahamanoa TaxID=1477025 RepID=UPI000E6D5C3A|nr:uncharacterized protein LOC113231970 [Hyposmocoma kahamanoa]
MEGIRFISVQLIFFAFCYYTYAQSDSKWTIVKDLKTPELVRAAKEALEVYGAENGKNYTYLQVDYAKEQLGPGKHYKAIFAADYVPREEHYYLECVTFVYQSPKPKLDVIESIECQRLPRVNERSK